MARLPRELTDIREEHEDDTALELEQVTDAHGLIGRWEIILADGRVTHQEARAMSAALQEHAQGDLESLNNNRRINGMYCQLCQPATAGSWRDLDSGDFRPEAA